LQGIRSFSFQYRTIPVNWTKNIGVSLLLLTKGLSISFDSEYPKLDVVAFYPIRKTNPLSEQFDIRFFVGSIRKNHRTGSLDHLIFCFTSTKVKI
jgi:hypothetical protein